MSAQNSPPKISQNRDEVAFQTSGLTPLPEIKLALLTGGFDKPYAFGLAMALVAKGVYLDVIGSDEVDRPEMHTNPNLRFLNLWGSQRANTTVMGKILRVLAYYGRLLRYAAVAKPKIFHILWNNKFHLFDRTLLMLYYKFCGKKIVFTAHNINAGKRDGNDGLLNRLTLRMQYLFSDHMFVHTEKMKEELLDSFGVRERFVTVIPFGINNSVPKTDLSPVEAKHQLGILEGEKTILFFGNIGPYKGLEYLVGAFQRIAERNGDYRLLIAGKVRGGCENYIEKIQQAINRHASRERITQRIEYIPEGKTEVYFKAAGLLVLPYTKVSQSGVLFLGYNFGLPVVATDVGSLRENVIEGKTGFLCRPSDPVDLARAIEAYFESDLYKGLATHRSEIEGYFKQKHSWDIVGETTRNVYADLLGEAHHETFGIGSHSCVQRAEMDR